MPMDTPCIETDKPRQQQGYGVVTYRKNGRKSTTSAHRWAWIQAYGPLERGQIVMHLCDNPPCVNLEHLRVGTQRENLLDMMAKGRGRNQFGAEGD